MCYLEKKERKNKKLVFVYLSPSRHFLQVFYHFSSFFPLHQQKKEMSPESTIIVWSLFLFLMVSFYLVYVISPDTVGYFFIWVGNVIAFMFDGFGPAAGGFYLMIRHMMGYAF